MKIRHGFSVAHNEQTMCEGWRRGTVFHLWDREFDSSWRYLRWSNISNITAATCNKNLFQRMLLRIFTIVVPCFANYPWSFLINMRRGQFLLQIAAILMLVLLHLYVKRVFQRFVENRAFSPGSAVSSQGGNWKSGLGFLDWLGGKNTIDCCKDKV